MADLRSAVEKLDNREFKGATVHCIADVFPPFPPSYDLEKDTQSEHACLSKSVVFLFDYLLGKDEDFIYNRKATGWVDHYDPAKLDVSQDFFSCNPIVWSKLTLRSLKRNALETASARARLGLALEAVTHQVHQMTTMVVVVTAVSVLAATTTAADLLLAIIMEVVTIAMDVLHLVAHHADATTTADRHADMTTHTLLLSVAVVALHTMTHM